jgi:hypothetical protein
MNKNETKIKAESGGEKCSKLAQMADIPASVMLELMEHYGKGREKYPGDENGPNYAKGYPWSLSYNAAMRHLLQFWGGEDCDPDTGSKHVIAAAWHCICLALFMEQHPDKDDRWEFEKSELSKAYVEFCTDLVREIKAEKESKRKLEQHVQEHEEEYMN